MDATGGGMCTPVGNAFAQDVLPAQFVDTSDFVWTGALNDYIAMGADFRAEATWSSGTAASTAFNTEQGRI